MPIDYKNFNDTPIMSSKYDVGSTQYLKIQHKRATATAPHQVLFGLVSKVIDKNQININVKCF